MMLRGKISRLFLVLSLMSAALIASQSSAQAAFHLISIREVYPGSAANPDAEFVELQMYAGGQNFVNGHSVTIYNDAGTTIGTFTFSGDVPNGDNQRSILVATAAAQTQFGVVPDLVAGSGGLVGAGGAACWENFDCVAWGTFSGSLPSPTGMAETAIPDGSSIERTIAPGCATLLESGDDTNDSATDFQAATPNPRNNSTTPTESPCGPGGGDTKAPMSQVKKPKHGNSYHPSAITKFKGSAEDNGSGLSLVEIALRQKRKGGCKWWNGSRFVKGGCADRQFEKADGLKSWSYELSKKLKPSDTQRIKNYILYSRGTDKAGNIESVFKAGQNKSKFEVT